MKPQHVEAVAKVMGETIESLAGVELSGIKLESVRRELLDVSMLDLDRHVAMHPPAIAYYGQLLREAKRMLAKEEHAFDREKSKWFAEARVVVDATAKNKSAIRADDVKGQACIRHQKEYEAWEERIDYYQAMVDTLESWYTAWQQKSYAMAMYARMDMTELNTSPRLMAKSTGTAPASTSRSVEDVRRVIAEGRKRQ